MDIAATLPEKKAHLGQELGSQLRILCFTFDCQIETIRHMVRILEEKADFLSLIFQRLTYFYFVYMSVCL